MVEILAGILKSRAHYDLLGMALIFLFKNSFKIWSWYIDIISADILENAGLDSDVIRLSMSPLMVSMSFRTELD